MNNNVKKVVFYSTRQISPYFDKEHLIECDSLIRYFSNLQKDETTRDDFSAWLSDLAFLFEYLQRMEVIGKEKEEDGLSGVQGRLNELKSIIYPQEELVDPHTIRVRDLALFLNNKKSTEKNDAFWEDSFNEYINLNRSPIYFSLCHYDRFKDWILSGKTTHLNRDLTESKGGGSFLEEEKARLKHRLGIYHRENNEYAVTAIWPWAEEREKNHDINWRTVAVNAVKELYPKCEEIVLVMHDNDFEWCQNKGEEKDKIVFKRRPLSNWNKSYEGEITPSEKDPLISFIVFQHNNGHVMNPLRKKEHAPKDVWNAIDKYLREVDKKMSEADENGLIYKMHDSILE